MKKILIIFGSTTGNTEYMSNMIGGVFHNTDIATEVKDVANISLEELGGEEDVLLLGCPAYGHDTVELQEDFDEFFEKIEDVNLKGRRFAAFAPGDSTYEHFCGSVDKIEETMESLGAVKIADGLKVDGAPEDFEDDIREWADSIVSGL